MQAFPHCYTIQASATAEGDVTLAGADKPSLPSAPPREFDGPGDRWSPEDLLVAAVADCFILTFRSIAKMSKLSWEAIECRAEGALDRVDKVMQFTEIHLFAKLTVNAEADAEKAKQLMQKAEAVCLITNSLKTKVHLEAEVVVA